MSEGPDAWDKHRLTCQQCATSPGIPCPEGERIMAAHIKEETEAMKAKWGPTEVRSHLDGTDLKRTVARIAKMRQQECE